MVSLEYDHARDGICVCGQTGLADLYTIVNEHNGAHLFPIGSICVKQFGRSDLNQQVKVLKRLLHLREAIAAGTWIELTSEYFSRAILKDLYEQGAFPPNEWNRGDGRKDYVFLLNMFNQHDRDTLTDGQKKKIQVLLWKIKTFVLADERLN